MNCNQTIQAHRYHDGELSTVERAAFESHLETCAGCRALIDDLASLSRTVNSAAPFEMPAMLPSQILRAWKQKQTQSFDRGVRRFAEFLTAAAASVMLFMWLGNNPAGYRTMEAGADAPTHEWEAVALVNHDSAYASEGGELEDVTQFMARDLSR